MSQPCEQDRSRTFLWFLVGPVVVLLLAIIFSWFLAAEAREIAAREQIAKAEYEELAEIVAQVDTFLADKDVLLDQVRTIRAFQSRRMEVPRVMTAVLQAQTEGASELESLKTSGHRCEISVVAPGEEDAARFADILRSTLELPDVELVFQPDGDPSKAQAQETFEIKFDLGVDGQ